MSQSNESKKQLQVVENAPVSLGVFSQMGRTLHDALTVASVKFDHKLDRINSATERMLEAMDKTEAAINAFTDALDKQREENFKE